ncbi:MAG: OsmC family peroxiredoxin [Rubrobacteraceae bacterium]
MPIVRRQAEVEWEGSLEQGKGSFAVGSWAVGEIPVDWASRTGDSQGNTSPEELMAAAHASCYAMALSRVLDSLNAPPEKLYVGAVCALDEVEGAPRITAMDLEIIGVIPSLDAEGFRDAAEQADQICPVTNALRGNVDISLSATLEEG